MGDKYEKLGRVIDRCESFIERRFAVALLMSDGFTFESYTTAGGDIIRDKRGIVLGQQVQLGAYRVDFTLTHPATEGARIVVELDGAKHHEATTAQATKDRARDRDLLGMGWKTIRFMGREVNRDALVVAKEAYALVQSMADPKKLDAVRAPRLATIRELYERQSTPEETHRYAEECLALLNALGDPNPIKSRSGL